VADVAEILRLMNHAADRLAEEDSVVSGAFGAAMDAEVQGYHKNQRRAQLNSYIAASIYAQTVLRMVATFMTETEVDHVSD
jgi:predicted trehalose synthase